MGIGLTFSLDIKLQQAMERFNAENRINQEIDDLEWMPEVIQFIYDEIQLSPKLGDDKIFAIHSLPVLTNLPLFVDMSKCELLMKDLDILHRWAVNCLYIRAPVVVTRREYKFQSAVGEEIFDSLRYLSSVGNHNYHWSDVFDFKGFIDTACKSVLKRPYRYLTDMFQAMLYLPKLMEMTPELGLALDGVICPVGPPLQVKDMEYHFMIPTGLIRDYNTKGGPKNVYWTIP